MAYIITMAGFLQSAPLDVLAWSHPTFTSRLRRPRPRKEQKAPPHIPKKDTVSGWAAACHLQPGGALIPAANHLWSSHQPIPGYSER